MAWIRDRFVHLLGLGVCVVMATGCVSEALDQAEPASNEEANVDVEASVAPLEGYVNGTLLHTVALDSGHSLRFYEFADGSQGVIETMQIGDEALLHAMDDQSTLAELYALARPGTAVPESLLESDARLVEKRLAAPPDPAPGDGDAESVLAERAAELLAETPEIQTHDSVCSGDLFGDSWGAQWFINNFCGSSNSSCPIGMVQDTTPQCTTNSSAASRSGQADEWMRFTQMEGDFNRKGRNIGLTFYNFSAVAETQWVVDVPPRNVMTFGFNSLGSSSVTNRIDGSSPCGHLHRFFKRCRWR